MRAHRRLLLTPLLAALGCGGGSWSNKELEFVNALPAKQDLQAKLPSDTARSGLAAAGSGIGTRKDALGIGERSKLYEDTRSGSDGFNQGLDAILALVEGVRSLPPTHREGDSRRLWGPFPNKEHPGFEARLVMDRVDKTSFAYRVEFRKQAGGEWFDVLTGNFLASSGIRKGVGALNLSGTKARAGGLSDEGLQGLDFLDVTYNTESTLYVALKVRAVTGDTLDYEYRELPDGGGRMRFLLDRNVTGSAFTLERLSVASAWRAGGEGRGEVQVRAGDGVGAFHHECWDDAFATTWFRTYDGATAGAESTGCKALADLLR
ncbi:MAG: hypothetical protein HYZ28_03590 [Myxococcales bacterium]|nr:hypothetical protein [Myxococcales bacterium]